MAPVRRNMRAESRRQNYTKFTTVIELGKPDISNQQDLHLEFKNINAKDLLDREPKLADYYFFRIKKATLRWTLKQFNNRDLRFERSRTGTYMASTGDISDGGYNNFFPNTNIGGWVNIMESGTAEYDKNRDFNLETFSANTYLPKIHSAWGGSRTFRPYVLDYVTSIYTSNVVENNNELATTGRYQKNFNAWLPVGGQITSAWCNDIRLIIPEYTLEAVQDEVLKADGTVDHYVNLRRHQFNPFYNITLSVEYEAKGMAQELRIKYPAPPSAPKKAMTIEPMANEINLDFEKVKEDVKTSVMDQITGSHPVIAAVATVAGLRNKRPRDEFKM